MFKHTMMILKMYPNEKILDNAVFIASQYRKTDNRHGVNF